MRTPKTLIIHLPVLGLNKIRLVTNKLTTDEKFTQLSFMIQLMSADPENTGDRCKILSLALVIMSAGGKIRAGVIRRRQIVVKD